MTSCNELINYCAKTNNYFDTPNISEEEFNQLLSECLIPKKTQVEQDAFIEDS